jgi:hypothetical protein
VSSTSSKKKNKKKTNKKKKLETQVAVLKQNPAFTFDTFLQQMPSLYFLLLFYINVLEVKIK